MVRPDLSKQSPSQWGAERELRRTRGVVGANYCRWRVPPRRAIGSVVATSTAPGDAWAEAAAYAVDDINGVYGPADTIGNDAQFALRDSRRLDEYLAANPHRIATKHAHSQLNPERLWGQSALKGIEFAFWALNDHFGAKGGKRFDRKNTLVIAAGARKPPNARFSRALSS